MASRLARVAAVWAVALAAAVAHAQTATRSFTALRPASGAAAVAHALVLELAPREALSGVHLALVSAAAPPPGSHYAVWVNGTLTADVETSGATQTLALAPSAFAPGVNTIQIALVPSRVSTAGEMAATAPAPIDDTRSTVVLDFAGLRPNPTPTLAQIPLAFDARAWVPRTVSVDLGQGDVSPAQLRAAALVVQGVASRMPHADLTVAYRSETTLVPWNRDREAWGIAQEEIASGDTLLVGMRSALSHELPASVMQAVTGPFVGIYPVNAGRSVVVVISGESDADCITAARYFADRSAAWPSSAAMVLRASEAAPSPASSLTLALADDDPALVRAALRFAAVHAKATASVADFPIRFSADTSGANLFFGRDSSVPARLRRHLPIYAPLQPGQAVSLPTRLDGQPFVAIVGARNATVADAVDMLRAPATWALFTQHATLFDWRSQTAVPLAIARRSPLAVARLVLSDPVVFWSVLGALLLASFVFVNLALKAQVAGRLKAAGEPPSDQTRNQTS